MWVICFHGLFAGTNIDWDWPNSPDVLLFDSREEAVDFLWEGIWETDARVVPIPCY